MTFMWLGVKTLQVLRCWTQHHNEIAPSHLCVCEVIVLDNPACLFYKTPYMFCMALKSSAQCSSPLIADFSFAAVSAQKGSWQQHGCSMCNVSCGRLFLEVKAHISQKKKIKPPSSYPSPKTKSFGVIPESSAEAESQLSPIRSLRAVTISPKVPDENCLD